jgi:TatA/E family protein of Tat protein translocase
MPNLGFQEIIVIFMIALLVFGPRKLPELGKSLGKGLREFRKATNDLKSSWDEQVRDIDKDVKETRRDFSKIGQDVRNTIHQPDKKKADAPPADSPASGAASSVNETPSDAATAASTDEQAAGSTPAAPEPTPSEKPAEKTS